MLMELLGNLPLAMKSSVGHFGLLNHFLHRVLLEQIIGDSNGIGDVQRPVQRRAAQVRIDHQNTLAILGGTRWPN